VVGGDYADFSLGSVGLGNSLDDAVGGLASGGVEDGEGSASGFFFTASLAVKN
jgi:hypothetical protein